MKAIDTNLVVRLLLGDDPVQTRVAEVLLQEGDVVITPTVLLEVMWVLESRYGASEGELRSALEHLARHPAVSIGAPEQAAEFFRLWDAGLDAQDAAHLAFVGEVEAFVTFDKPFAKRAAKAKSLTPVRVG